MIRHVVLFGLHPDVSEEQINAFMEGLRGLVPKITEIRSLEVALDEGGGERAASFGLLTTFDDFDALRRYQQHPDHQAVGAQIFAACEWVKAWDYTLKG